MAAERSGRKKIMPKSHRKTEGTMKQNPNQESSSVGAANLLDTLHCIGPRNGSVCGFWARGYKTI